MSRFATSWLSTTGLLLVTLLAIVPSKVYAQQNSSVKSPVIAQPLTGANIPTATKPVTSSQPTTKTSTNPVIGNTPVPIGQKSTVKPATTATTAAPSQPAVTDLVNLVLRLKEKKVYVYKGDQVIAKYPVAIGKKGWETPTGDWYVMEKIANPGWTSFKNGQVMKPGAENPMGERWIGFYTDGKDMIGFHGTTNVKSIGTAASHGCVRMLNKDVKELFPLVKIGTTVKVVNE